MTTLFKKYKIESLNKDVFLIDLKGSDIFSTRFVCKLGSDLERFLHKKEGKEFYGISHLIEHLSFKSSKNYTTSQIKSKLKDLGDHNAYTSTKEVVYYVNTISDHYQDCINILSDVVFNTLENISETEFETEKSIVISEINDNNSDPSFKFSDISDTMLFNLDSRDTILGTVKDIKSYTLNDVISYKKYLNNLDNVDIYIIYDSEKLTYNDILNKLFNTLKVIDFSNIKLNEYTVKDLNLIDNKINIIKLNTPEDSINLDFISLVAEIKDFKLFQGICLLRDYINYISNQSLFEIVREKYGKCYSIHLSCIKKYDRNFIIISSQVDLGTSEEVFNHIKESISGIFNGFSDQEFNKYNSLDKVNKTYSNLYKLAPVNVLVSLINDDNNFINVNYDDLSTNGLDFVINKIDTEIRQYELLKRSLKILNTQIQLDNNIKFISEYK